MPRTMSNRFPWSRAVLRTQVREAIQSMWTTREQQAERQLSTGTIDAGTRGSVTGGRHMDAFASLLGDLAAAAGFHSSEVRFRSGVEVPGFYRPTKKWDLVVVRDNRLCAVIELKSMSGSYGNNLNNRSEEALGSATDIWAAYRAGTLGLHQPWLGYLFVIRDEPRSRAPVRIPPTPLTTDPVFAETRYIDRYGILCERMVLERQYSAAAYLSAPRGVRGTFAEPRPGLEFEGFARAFFGHLIGCT
jgi:hypothetical protein